MFLLEFVNTVRRALRCEPLQVLEIGDVSALETAMHCRLQDGSMSFSDPQQAQSVATWAGLPLTNGSGAVELPAAISSYVRHCSAA